MKTSIPKETIGTFIDAIYAIAVTILALQVPDTLATEFSISSFGTMLLEYALSFLILFALWIQHRRINDLNHNMVRSTLIWINCLILLLVCLIPRATTLVFAYGGDVTLAQLEASLNHGAGWTLSEFVDIFYITLVIAADLGLLVLVSQSTDKASDEEYKNMRNSKITITVLTVTVLTLSLLLPMENRYALLLIPLALMFERTLSQILFRQKNKPST